MNDEYLWDKSGEPDPEIRKLEEILGTLRYQPKPFEIPPEVLMRRRRSYVPLFAIAASLLLALLAGGIWLRTRSSQAPVKNESAHATAPTATPSVTTIKTGVETPELVAKGDEKPIRIKQRRPRSRSVPAMSAQDRQEALAAKAQLMLALRLASEKLNEIQRKTLTPMPSNQIKNQHKVG
jgi:hypothetical protein